jgi:hypothetical protein
MSLSEVVLAGWDRIYRPKCDLGITVIHRRCKVVTGPGLISRRSMHPMSLKRVILFLIESQKHSRIPELVEGLPFLALRVKEERKQPFDKLRDTDVSDGSM